MFVCCVRARCSHAERRRKLPSLDSKAAIREKREKEIQMKVNFCRGAAARCSCADDAHAGASAAEKIAVARLLFYSFLSWGVIIAAARRSECNK